MEKFLRERNIKLEEVDDVMPQCAVNDILVDLVTTKFRRFEAKSEALQRTVFDTAHLRLTETDLDFNG